jgi:hypothetical protein
MRATVPGPLVLLLCVGSYFVGRAIHPPAAVPTQPVVQVEQPAQVGGRARGRRSSRLGMHAP